MTIIARKTVPYNGEEVPVCALETINFSRLLSQEPAEVRKLLQCCQEAGFFYLDLQDIDGRRTLDDHQRLLALMRRFFNSAHHKKNEIGLPSLEHGYDLPPPSFAYSIQLTNYKLRASWQPYRRRGWYNGRLPDSPSVSRRDQNVKPKPPVDRPQRR